MTGWLGVAHLLTPQQVAESLAVSPATVARLRRAGHLAAIRVGAAYRYHPDDITRYITTHRST